MNFIPFAPGVTTSQLFAPTGLPGATAATRYVGGTASGAPGSGTFAVGDMVIDQTGVIWVCTAAGTPGTWAPVGGAQAPKFLRTPVEYAPGTLASPLVNSTTMAAFDSTNLQTGSFKAPLSGSVVVELNCTMQFSTGSAGVALGLAAHGTVTPILCNEPGHVDSSATLPRLIRARMLVTGLTPGTSYNLDLLGAVRTGSCTILALGQTSTTPTLLTVGIGGPASITVMAV